MKLLRKVTQLFYTCKTSEQPGIWSEKIICDILKIQFNTNRSYINKLNYPSDLKNDISNNLSNLLNNLKIDKHLGNENNHCDFKTIDNQTVSLKTNIISNKICPQNIGQTTLKNFNLKTKHRYDIQTINDYKMLVFNKTNEILNLYLKNLFSCNHLISLKYDTGEIFYLKKNENVLLSKCNFVMSKNINNWKESMTLSVKINDNQIISLAEFQIHNNRDCIKCRFNLESIFELIEENIITGISLTKMKLTNKYNIKIIGNEIIKNEIIKHKVKRKVNSKGVTKKIKN